MDNSHNHSFNDDHSTNNAGSYAMVDQDTYERKRRFVFQLLLDPKQPWLAGKAAYPERSAYHQAMAGNVAEAWTDKDEDVRYIKSELIKQYGAEYFLPGKYDLALKAYEVVNAPRTQDDKLKAIKLYAEIMGFIEKPNVNNGIINGGIINKVMEVPVYSTDDEWEDESFKQQQALIAVATE